MEPDLYKPRSVQKDRQLLFAVLLGIVAKTTVWAKPAIRITYPDDGATIVAGQQNLEVTVEPVDTVFQKVTVFAVPVSDVPLVLEKPPYRFFVNVPKDRLGPGLITAVALTEKNERLQTSIKINLVSGSSAQSIRVDPVELWMPEPGRNIPFLVLVKDPTGVETDITLSPATQAQSQNPRVIAVDTPGHARSVELGKTTILFTYQNLSKEVPVAVGYFGRRGDLDGNGIIDLQDLAILRRGLGSSATAADDPRDLNQDGHLDDQDVLILKELCSHPNCL